jgi:hypothetical protein
MSSLGFEVLVQLVIAASTTEPFVMFGSAATASPGTAASAFFGLSREGRALPNPDAT